jgi:hypothetical protein
LAAAPDFPFAPRSAHRQHLAMPASERSAALRLARQLRAGVRDEVRAIAGTLAQAQRRIKPANVHRKGVGDFVTDFDVRAELAKIESLLRPLAAAK